MENISYNGESYEDLIFENRHKSYGAYELRKKYEKNLLIGLIVASSLLIILAFLPKIIALLSPSQTSELVTLGPSKLSEMEAPPLEEQIIEPPKIEIPQVESIKFVPPEIVETVTKVEEIATIDEIKNTTNVSDVTQEGKKDEVVEKVESIIATTQKEEEPLLIVDQMPEFAGGDEALIAFIQKNTKYPQQAQDFNIQGRVFVQFVVGKDGRISNAKILKGIGGGCNEEALRIVGIMPAWEPGKQGGNKVPVYVKIPINFQLK